MVKILAVEMVHMTDGIQVDEMVHIQVVHLEYHTENLLENVEAG
jgi:hypothetical protein